MRKLLATSTLMLAVGVWAQTSNDAANYIKHSNVAFAAAMRANDIDAMTNMYTADAAFMPANLPAAHGQSAIRAAWTSFLSQFSSTDVTLTSDDVQQSGDLAVETGHYLVHLVPKGTTTTVTDSGKYLLAWKKVDGRWKIYRDIFNSDLPVPTAPH